MALRVPWKKIFLGLFALAFAGGLLGGGAVALLFYWASRDLPNITRIADYAPPLATTVLARDGSQLGVLCH